MAEPDKTREPAINRENKSSAMRWAIGLVVVLALGAAAWVMSDHRGEVGDLTPPQQTGAEDQSNVNQPPAVIPNQDPAAPAAPPATSGAGTQ